MASPHPEDELGRLQKALAKGLPPLLVITGPSEHFRAVAMGRVLAAVPKDAELKVLDAVDVRAAGSGDVDDDTDDEDETAGDGADGLAQCPELQDLRGGGLFARTTFLCIRRGSNWWKNHAPALAAQLPKFAKGSGLVLEAAKLDRRKKVAATLVKGLVDSGACFDFRDLFDQPYDRSRSPIEGELCKWVVLHAKELGVPLKPEAAWLLVAQVGKVPAELLAELGRLRALFGAEPRNTPLGPADLRGKVTCSFGSTPFEFAEAVLAGDRRAAMRSAHAMFDRSVRSKDGRPMDPGGVLPFTTSWLYQTLATTYEGRQMLDSGVSPRDLAGRCGVRQFADRFVDQVRQHDVGKLQRGLQALHHCQRMSRLSGEEPALLLERFLVHWFDGAPIPTSEELEL